MARIMIVESNRDDADILGLAVSFIGHEPLPAYGGRQALELVIDQRPDLVLLDLVMPEMDGYETLQRLRSNLPIADMPVIVVTASTGAGVEQRVLEIGGSACLRKPLSLAALQGAITRCLPSS